MKMHELAPGMNNAEFKAIISQATIGKTNGAKKRNYLNLILEDRTGEMDAKFWNPTDDDLKNCVQGAVVSGSGDIINYNGAKQMKVIRLDVLDVTDEERMRYLKSAPIKPEVMMGEIEATIDGMKDPDYQAITRNLIDEHKEAFMTYPAATRNHHDFVSGLLYHTYCMLKIAKGVACVYGDLNEDLLYAGVILHDLGKTEELSGAITPHYTTKGNLLGHISIGNTMIKETCDLLDIKGEKVTLLQHMILSHHGKLEYGSPVLPQIKEAEILSLVDNIDARHQMFDKAYEQVEPGETTKRIFALENRTLYRPEEKEEK
jgi:3'-5' exoribonuclease